MDATLGTFPTALCRARKPLRKPRNREALKNKKRPERRSQTPGLHVDAKGLCHDQDVREPDVKVRNSTNKLLPCFKGLLQMAGLGFKSLVVEDLS